VRDYINSSLPCPGMCMWRDDLDRRLDNNFDLKLRYPSLISGEEALGLMLDRASIGEGQERRRRALNSYLGHQYTQDRMVRFKQADLPASSLLKLFVDVPVFLQRRRREHNRTTIKAFERAALLSIRASIPSDRQPDEAEEIAFERATVAVASGQAFYPSNIPYRTKNVGAASLLLHAEPSDTFSQTVIEGAPGQGKSTMAQYIAQVHRFRLIPRPPSGDVLPDENAKSPLNLPFKLELRDVAQWLDGFDPWEPQPKTPHNKSKSLESAIAGHVEKYSGGVPFDAGDFLMALASVPVLIILDALDEVADLDQRRRVVEEIEACAARLKQQACDVRIIVTSRPTAIADSPTFAEDDFTYLALAPLSSHLTLVYADRWAAARRLDAADKTEVRRILSAKLSAPHMAELAKNTMQLSILLNLIHRRGESLPDKRTELYDKYIDVFFMREAEKSATVKRYTDLLIDIHRYLGYYLHARAELDQSTGRISYAEMKRVVTEYLESEHQPTDAIDDLLFGMVQRVVALVSRVEGTYEFEVQPLREYFAARHLYDSASYSPTGRPKSGTKPDRFDGIAPNSYWLNVTRFFCGCFSKGELLDLADRLDELVKKPNLNLLTYPRMLGIALLQDWVFTQSPKATERATQAIFDDFGLRWASIESFMRGSTRSRSISDASLQLTEATGTWPLLSLSWNRISTGISGEGLNELCRYLASLNVDARLWQLWLAEYIKHAGASRKRWLQIGSALHIFSCMPKSEVSSMLRHDKEAGEIELDTLVDGGIQIEVLPAGYHVHAIRSVLDRSPYSEERLAEKSPRGALDVLRVLANRDTWWHIAIGYAPEGAFGEALRYSWPKKTIKESRAVKELHDITEKIRPPVAYNSSTLWRSMTDDLNASFGKSWLSVEVAVISGSVSTYEPYVRAASLLSNESSLIDRVRSSRRRSGNLTWWLEQVDSAADQYDFGFWALTLYAWANPTCLSAAVGKFSEAISNLDVTGKQTLGLAFRRSHQYSRHAGKCIDLTAAVVKGFDSAMSSILLHRIEDSAQYEVVRDQLIEDLEVPGVADSVLTYLVSEISAGKLRNEEGLEWARKCYAAGAKLDLDAQRSVIGSAPSKRLESDFARRVLDNCWEMPSELVILAIRSIGNKLPRTVPVGRIAETENWFVAE
jgi:hypothetical protein